MIRNLFLLCFFGLALSVSALAKDTGVLSLSLMSSSGKLEISRRVENSRETVTATSLAQNSRTAVKVGDAMAWRLEKPGATISLSPSKDGFDVKVIRVLQDTDGTPLILPVFFVISMPQKGKPVSVDMPDGSVFSLSLD